MPGGLDTGRHTGLSGAEAARRLTRDGPNELPSARPRSAWQSALKVVREPMLGLLLAGATIYLLLGDPQEAGLLLASVFAVLGLTLWQERKTERALQALRDLSSPRALVVRDGQTTRVAGREVVRGDLMVLAEGERVPAEAVVLEELNLSVDESLLTGESVPVAKRAGTRDLTPGRPGGEQLPFVYAGTLIVQGRALALVCSTAAATELGRIGRAIERLEPGPTPLQREIGFLVRVMAAVGLGLCAVAVLVYGLVRQAWLGGLLAGIAMAMSLLPEELPVVLTVFIALGAFRISRRQVLARRPEVIETLGAATVLCVDKTGTLTHNRMSVARLWTPQPAPLGGPLDVDDQSPGPLPDSVRELAEFGVLASHRGPFDPVEQALTRFGEERLVPSGQLHRDWTLIREYPLSPGLLSLALAWAPPGAQACTVAAKGAPEAIAGLCHLEGPRLVALQREVAAMAGDALRVLGVARASARPRPLDAEALPADQRDFDFQFLGLIGFADPVRGAVPQAVRDCAAAGVRVVMITGDHVGTALSVARQIGLPGTALTGPELAAVDDAELARRAREVAVYARVMPEQKLRLVQAFQAAGEVVAMTGDGVNDAPALRAADIGVAMGGRGTDVAREAAALVVLDDDFSSIVQAVRLGRRIDDNLRAALAYIVAVHVPLAGLTLLPVLVGWPLILLPVHLVVLELIIDPACSTVFEAEPEQPDVMTRPPRPAGTRLLGPRTLGLSLLQGLGVLLLVLGVFSVALGRGQGVAEARALTFTALTVANLGLILTSLSRSRGLLQTIRTPNPALWSVSGGALALLGLALAVPALRNLFSFTALHPDDLLLCLAVGVASVALSSGLQQLPGFAGRAG